MVSRIEEWLTEREMWSPGEKNAYRKGDVVSRREERLQKGRCGLQERGTAYREIKSMLTKGIYETIEMKVDIDLRKKHVYFIAYR